MSSGQSNVLLGLTTFETTNDKQLQKDLWDLFCSLALALRPRSHSRRLPYKTFPDSFLGNEAITNLASLKFRRTADSTQNVPKSIVTLKLSASDVKVLMDSFLEACLFKDATDSNRGNYPPFKTAGIYQFTFKGLRILADFIQDNAIESEGDHLVALLTTLPIPRPKLCRLERRALPKEEIVISPTVITNLFCHFVGEAPNYGLESGTGVLLVDFVTRVKLLDKIKAVDGVQESISPWSSIHCFTVSEMIRWLCNFTSINTQADAVEIGAHFVRFGLIALADGKLHTVVGPASSTNPLITAMGRFLYSPTAIYAVTDEGRRVAQWILPKQHINLNRGTQYTNPTSLITTTYRRFDDDFYLPFDENGPNATHLRDFIKQPHMRLLFREFLRDKSREYQLSFWLDVEDLKNKSDRAQIIITPIVPEIPVASSSRTPMEILGPEQVDEAQQHGSLKERPFLIYNTYLAAAANCKLPSDIGEDLFRELQVTLEGVLKDLTERAMLADTEPAESYSLTDTQLQVLVELYSRIQSRVFRIMALKYVPKFLTHLSAQVDPFSDPVDTHKQEATDLVDLIED